MAKVTARETNSANPRALLRASVLDPALTLAEASAMQCHACGCGFKLGSGQRVAFRDACSDCGVDLHVCSACTHHDPVLYNGCREPNAERVADFHTGNRCEYFRPDEAATGAKESARDQSIDALEALFKKT
jgi:hypothetical protein